MAKQTWSQEEVEALRRMYPDIRISPQQMEECFGRSWRAIVSKAYSVGIRRPLGGTRTWTDDDSTALRRMYPDPCVSPVQMEKCFGRTWSSIISQAETLGLSRPAAGIQAWIDEEIAALCQMYTDAHVSPKQMEEFFGRSWQAIRLKAWKLGLARPRPINEHINHSYFHEITTSEKAYWLGWLASDGYVAVLNRGHYICLQLQERDESIIVRFVQAIAPEAVIYRSRNAVCVRIGSKEMLQDLACYGVDANKTKNFKWPNNIPNEFAMEFLLGYFDGDGCLAHYHYGKKKSIDWVLLGTKPFLITVRQHIQSFAQVKLNDPIPAHKHKSFHLYKIRTCNYDAIRRIDTVLNRSGLGLPRKHL